MPQSIQTERQWPPSGVHSNTFHHDGKICPAWWEGEGVNQLHALPLYHQEQWGRRPEGLITRKVVVYAAAERAGTLPLFLLFPNMYSVAHAHVFLRPHAHCNRWRASTRQQQPVWLHTERTLRMSRFVLIHLLLCYWWSHRVHAYIGRYATGWMYLPTQLERILQLCTWWKI